MKNNDVMIDALADITSILQDKEINGIPIGFFEAIEISENILEYIERHFTPKRNG